MVFFLFFRFVSHLDSDTNSQYYYFRYEQFFLCKIIQVNEGKSGSNESNNKLSYLTDCSMYEQFWEYSNKHGEIIQN